MFFRRWLAGRLSLAVEYDLRNRVYAHLQRLSYSFFDRHQTGQLLSRATVDVQAVRVFLGYGLIFFSQNSFTVISVLVVLTILNAQLTLIALAITPVLGRARLPLLARQPPGAEGGAAARGRRHHPGRGERGRRARGEGLRTGAERVRPVPGRLRADLPPGRASGPPTGAVRAHDVGAAQRGDRLRAAGGRLSGGAPPADAGRVLRRQRLPAAACAAVALDRHVGGPVPAGDGLRRAGVRGAGRGARHRRAAGRASRCRRDPASFASSTSASATTATGRCSPTSTWRSRPARRWP